MNAAVTAALLASHKEAASDPISRLTKAGAIQIDKAVTLDFGSDAEQALVDEALREGMIHRRADGRLFVNRRAVEERDARLGGRILIALLVGLSIAASIGALIALR